MLLLSTLFASEASGRELIEVEAPAELETQAARLREMDAVDLGAFRQLLGLDEDPTPFRVLLAPESSELARNVPQWIAGFARGEEGVIVLFPARVPSYPYSSMVELLRHELAHILIDRASGDGSVPRWFHEGLAMLAEGGWQVSDRSRLAMAVLRSGKPDLEKLSGLFNSGEPGVSWAYAVSGAFVRDLVRGHDQAVVAVLFADLRRGSDFDTAFKSAVGVRPETELDSFWRRSRILYRWLPVITSSTVLWIAITMLAVVAIQRRRTRDLELLRQWEEEERRELSATSEPGETVH